MVEIMFSLDIVSVCTHGTGQSDSCGINYLKGPRCRCAII